MSLTLLAENDYTLAQSQEFVKEADGLIGEMKLDSALSLYKKVIGNFGSNINEQETRVYLDALFGSCDVNLTQGHYEAALNDLELARDICRTKNIEDLRLYLNSACIYIVLATQTRKDKYLKMMLPYGRKAFDMAYKQKDYHMIYRAFGNLSNVAFNYADTMLVKDEEAKIKALLDEGNWEIKKCYLNYQAIKNFIKGNYDESFKIYRQIEELIPPEPRYARMRAQLIKKQGFSKAYSEEKEEAMKLFERAIDSCEVYNLHDVRLSSLHCMAIACDLVGDSINGRKYYQQATILSDSLASYRIAGDLIELEYMHTQRELQLSLEQARLRAKVTTMIGFTALAIALIVVVFLLILRRKNSVLQSHSDMLRQRMRDMYSRQHISGDITANEIKSLKTDVEKEENTGNVEDNPSIKYEGSNLLPEDVDRISKKVEMVLESEAVLSPDFSLCQLAEMIEEHPKAVSQVVNEVYKTNFPSVVNRIRIIEVCRRFDSPEYSNWSVEGIAESVGYKSRSSFSSNFKKVTGLGIREYKNRQKD